MGMHAPAYALTDYRLGYLMKIIGLGPGSGRVMPLICRNRCRPPASLSLSILYIESRDKCVTADAERPRYAWTFAPNCLNLSLKLCTFLED